MAQIYSPRKISIFILEYIIDYVYNGFSIQFEENAPGFVKVELCILDDALDCVSKRFLGGVELNWLVVGKLLGRYSHLSSYPQVSIKLALVCSKSFCWWWVKLVGPTLVRGQSCCAPKFYCDQTSFGCFVWVFCLVQFTFVGLRITAQIKLLHFNYIYEFFLSHLSYWQTQIMHIVSVMWSDYSSITDLKSSNLTYLLKSLYMKVFCKVYFYSGVYSIKRGRSYSVMVCLRMIHFRSALHSCWCDTEKLKRVALFRLVACVVFARAFIDMLLSYWSSWSPSLNLILNENSLV